MGISYHLLFLFEGFQASYVQEEDITPLIFLCLGKNSLNPITKIMNFCDNFLSSNVFTRLRSTAL